MSILCLILLLALVATAVALASVCHERRAQTDLLAAQLTMVRGQAARIRQLEQAAADERARGLAGRKGLGVVSWQRDQKHTFGEEKTHGWVRVVDGSAAALWLRFTRHAFAEMRASAQKNPEDAP